MRILPSQSSGMKPNVGSTVSFTTSRSQPYRSAMRCPVRDAGAAERIDADREPGAGDGVHVDDGGEIVHVGADVVVPWVVRGVSRALVRHARHAARDRPQQRRWRGSRSTRVIVGVGRAAVRRVVLEAAVLGRIVRRRDDDAVGQAAGWPRL